MQGLVLETVFFVLVVLFQVAVYDFALRGRKSAADHVRANGVDSIAYVAYALLLFLITTPLSSRNVRPPFATPPP